MEFNRVSDQWFADGCPANLLRYIFENANVGPDGLFNGRPPYRG
jgi:hypothetical protein